MIVCFACLFGRLLAPQSDADADSPERLPVDHDAAQRRARFFVCVRSESLRFFAVYEMFRSTIMANISG